MVHDNRWQSCLAFKFFITTVEHLDLFKHLLHAALMNHQMAVTPQVPQPMLATHTYSILFLC
jgi:hypothetical protein